MAADPRYVEADLKTASVQINYSTTDGYSSKAAYSGKRAGSPDVCINEAAFELARLAEMFGFGDDLEANVKEARQKVREFFTEEPTDGR